MKQQISAGVAAALLVAGAAQASASLGDQWPLLGCARAGDCELAITSSGRAMQLRARLLTRDNRFDEALKASVDAIREAVAAEGALSRTAIDIRLNLAYGLLVRSRTEEARGPREEALAALRELGGANEIRAAMEESRLARQAYLMHAIGFDDAKSTIERARSLELGQGNMPFAAYDHIYVAPNLGMLGRHVEGLDVLAAAPSFEAERGAASGGGAYPNAIKLARARLMLVAGDPITALKWIPKSDGRVPKHYRLGLNGLVLGEALCASGQREQGIATLLARIASAEPNSHPHAPQIARARAVAGHCALMAGQRPLAQRLAAQSRAAFTAQPGVSPYFKAPLVKLERALGLNLPPV